VRFAFIRDQGARHKVAFMCRCLGVSTSGYYAWLGRPPSMRKRGDARLALQIRALHRRSLGTYGSPRIHLDLAEDGVRVGRKRVARLMLAENLFGRLPRRWKRTTSSNHQLGYSPNLLKQEFKASRPNKVWVGDITYIRTWEGWVYLDARRVVGFALDDQMPASLPLRALRQARTARKPPCGLIHHSDRGSQYGSDVYREELREMGAEQSMSGKGNCFDNAVAESFFSTLKTELLHRFAWSTKRAAIDAVTGYINNFYNPVRRHSSAGNTSPIECELDFRHAALAA